MNSGKFQHYDYGKRENLIIYNSSTPPEYNLKYVTIPVALYGGPNDHFANPDASVYMECFKQINYIILRIYRTLDIFQMF